MSKEVLTGIAWSSLHKLNNDVFNQIVASKTACVDQHYDCRASRCNRKFVAMNHWRMCKTKLELCQVSLNYLTTPDLRIWVCVSVANKT